MNTLSDSTSARRTATRLGLALIVFIGIEIALSHALTYIFHVQFQSELLGYIVPYASVYVVGFILFLLITRPVKRSSIPKEKWGFWHLVCAMAASYAGGYICNLAYSLINTLVTGASAVTMTTTSFSSLVDVNPIFSFILMTIVVPVVEEFVFRKTLIGCTRKYGEKIAIIFSSAMFALFHMNLQQLFYAFAIGLVFGYVYSKTGNLVYTIIFHSINNMLGYFASFALNGLAEAMGASGLSDLSSALSSSSGTLTSMSTILPWLILEYTVSGIAYALVIIGIIHFFRKIIKVRFTKDAPNQLTHAAPLYLNVGVILFGIMCLVMLVFRQVTGTM